MYQRVVVVWERGEERGEKGEGRPFIEVTLVEVPLPEADQTKKL